MMRAQPKELSRALAVNDKIPIRVWPSDVLGAKNSTKAVLSSLQKLYSRASAFHVSYQDAMRGWPTMTAGVDYPFFERRSICPLQPSCAVWPVDRRCTLLNSRPSC